MELHSEACAAIFDRWRVGHGLDHVHTSSRWPSHHITLRHVTPSYPEWMQKLRGMFARVLFIAVTSWTRLIV